MGKIRIVSIRTVDPHIFICVYIFFVLTEIAKKIDMLWFIKLFLISKYFVMHCLSCHNKIILLWSLFGIKWISYNFYKNFLITTWIKTGIKFVGKVFAESKNLFVGHLQMAMHLKILQYFFFWKVKWSRKKIWITQTRIKIVSNDLMIKDSIICNQSLHLNNAEWLRFIKK